MRGLRVGGTGHLLEVDSASVQSGRLGRRMDERSARLAENEAIFRAGNEVINDVVGDRSVAPFLCECGDRDCFERVPVSHDAYEAVRAHPARFLVAPGHEDLTAGEVVVEDFSHYSVVEKQGAEAAIVERADPRSGDR